ncbi:LysR family transcriptional regulator [Nocardia mangyaensis]|uniref:LysR family transcriptional regulator n=1 Tax=Nocardia mangyaensis TaxID=2213200 RepID=A0A1J0W2U7_9NOCA|nr:LysR family transcriptional regulator [Nocardia mangyaensis]APE38590.1 LysR family transcriptional regulator [Nocardia mangyaensis]
MDGHRVPRADRPLDLHRLQQFLAVAENAGFTSAAAQLHLTQQALSTAIRQLERQLGVTLFDRTGRRLRPTAAGEVLRDGARALLAAAATLAEQTYEAGTESPRPFVIGHTPAITAEEVYLLLASVRARLPTVSVTARQMFPDALVHALYDGQIDLALRRGVAMPAHLASAIIAYDPVRLAVARTHRLADRDIVRIDDLRTESVMVWAPPGHSFYTDFLLSTCRRAGFEPRFVVNRIQGTPPVTAVADNDCVAFVTAPAGPAVGGLVRVVELADPPLAPTQALWLPHTVSPVRDLLTVQQPTTDAAE